jgi:hypothetical protein
MEVVAVDLVIFIIVFVAFRRRRKKSKDFIIYPDSAVDS